MSVIPYTKIPNGILDAMQTMSEAESKLTALLCRQTYGYHTNSVRLTWNDIQESCGFSSRSTVAKAIELVEERGFFAAGRRSVWLVNSTESVPNDGSNSTESVPNDGSNSTESVLDYSTQSVPSFKEIKDPNGSKKKNTTPTPPPDPTLAEMVNALVDATGMSAHLNWGKLSDLARELLGGGYTAGQVAQVYASGGWWYACDWRGQKGQRPGVTAVRETIRLGAAWNGQIPARASPAANGGQVTRAEAAALEYAAMKESFFQE